VASVSAKNPGEARRNYLEYLQPKPLVPDFGDADLRTLAALGISPPHQLMKARTD
jgi:hypothetical protein